MASIADYEVVVPEAASMPSSVRHSYLRLFLAIRDQAIYDGKEDEWRAYYVESPEWRRVWAWLLQSDVSIDSSREYRKVFDGFDPSVPSLDVNRES